MSNVDADLATLERGLAETWWPPTSGQREEMRAALDRVEAEIARLERLVDAHERAARLTEAAEAEVARLRDGLREVVNVLGPEHFGGELEGLLAEGNEALRVARALLAEGGAATNLARPHLDLETKVIPNADDGAA